MVKFSLSLSLKWKRFFYLFTDWIAFSFFIDFSTPTDGVKLKTAIWQKEMERLTT